MTREVAPTKDAWVGHTDVGYLSVVLGERAIAIHARWVREVCAVLPITRIPLAPPHVMGVFALRRKLIPLIDFAIFIGDAPTERISRFIVVGSQGLVAALPTSRVMGVEALGGVVPPNLPSAPYLGTFITGEVTGASPRLILDVDALLQAARPRS